MIKFDEKDDILKNIARITQKRIANELDITITIDSTMGEFDGKIQDCVFSAGSYSQLLDTLGRFIRNPEIENGVFHSEKEICGMYFASHNNNYYQCAPLEEIYEHIEDIAFWGANAIKVWFDLYFFESMEAGAEFAEKLKNILRYAKSIGMKTIMGMLANEAFRNSSKELRADWTGGHDGYIKNLNDHYHVEICPSKPGGLEKILEYRKAWLEVFSELQLDYVTIGAYDEGGCTCKECAPWGSNGYIKIIEALIPLIHQYMPETEIIVSLWMFGEFTGNNVEFEGLKDVFLQGRLKECKYLTAEPEYQRYAFEKGMPRPLLGFPEISMCKTIPWGGYGTNPIPMFLQELWDRDGNKLVGGLPYSEGFYEEINKVCMLRLYRDGQHVSKTIRQYLAYEFDLEGTLLDKAIRAIFDMEETLFRGFEPGHRYPIKNVSKVFEIEKTILEINETLSKEKQRSKKWQMIYLRAVIDAELARNDFKRNDKVLEYFNKIIDLCYLHNAGFHVKPDIVNDEKYGRILTVEELKIIAKGGKID